MNGAFLFLMGGRLHFTIEEIINYIDALDYGINRIETLPLSLRLIKEMHEVLLRGVRGMNKSPGEFRKSQNWIGGTNINNAQYVPPSINYLDDLLYNLESYMYEEDKVPVLIKAALIHVHFEMIHPFLDGNGRMGRLLIVLYLMSQNVLSKPILYLSRYFMIFREEYYECLRSIQENSDYEKWLKFFLEAVIAMSDDACSVQVEILNLKESEIIKINKLKNGKRHLRESLEFLFEKPIITSIDLQNRLNLSKQTASRILQVLVDLDIIKQVNNDKRNIRYAYYWYIKLFM